MSDAVGTVFIHGAGSFGLFVMLVHRAFSAMVDVTHDPRHDSENSANSNLVRG